jgi:hypothetical protein
MTVNPQEGCPRVFRSFTDVQGNEHGIDFICPFHERDHPLIFKAYALMGETKQLAIVKIVYGQYGEEVHRFLAERGMAPTLYGTQTLEGGPMMIVMEDLNINDGWTTLDFITPKEQNAAKNEVIREKVHPRLQNIVRILKTNDFVHGDIRSNNIMVKKGHEGECYLIDFDWAGKVGTARYPFDLNTSITRRRIPGAAIMLEDDQQMMDQIINKA